MTKLPQKILALAALVSACLAGPAYAVTCPPLLDHQLTSLQDGKPMPLCQYAGKVILVVNTASYCGFTSQYDGLEKLYARLKDKGLVVLGFPSNDFGEQEPGTEKEIAEFCRLTYGVEFPMAGKTEVVGDQRHPFYAWAQAQLGEAAVPGWNFHKLLIGRDGRLIAAFPTRTEPTSEEVRAAIAAALAAPRTAAPT